MTDRIFSKKKLKIKIQKKIMLVVAFYYILKGNHFINLLYISKEKQIDDYW